MKKNWQAPRILVQEFEANEYVATCYSLYCLVAGDGEKLKFKKNTFFTEDVENWGGRPIIHDGLEHGAPCADGSSWDADQKRFYESGKPSAQVSAVDVYGQVDNTKQYATWNSTDGRNMYTHYGYAVPVDGRPNHS